MSKFAALCASVFPLDTKNLRGGYPPPSVLVLRIIILIVFKFAGSLGTSRVYVSCYMVRMGVALHVHRKRPISKCRGRLYRLCSNLVWSWRLANKQTPPVREHATLQCFFCEWFVTETQADLLVHVRTAHTPWSGHTCPD